MMVPSTPYATALRARARARGAVSALSAAVTAGSSEYTAVLVIRNAAQDSKLPSNTESAMSAARSFLALPHRPACNSRGISALHAVNTGSVRNERIQNVSNATLCVAPGTTPNADALAVIAAYVPMRENAPRNIHPISLSILDSTSTSTDRDQSARHANAAAAARRPASDRGAPAAAPKLEPPASDVPTSPTPPSPSPSGHASHPFLAKPLKNHAAVSAWPRETAAADPGSPRPSASGCAAATMTPRVTAPVAVHATIGVTPSLCPMNTPSAALDAAKNGRPSARTATYVRTMGATSGGTCMRLRRGPASAASAHASTAPDTKDAATAAVIVFRCFAASSSSSSEPPARDSPAATFAMVFVTTMDIAKHISAAKAKSEDDGASAAR
mmetsp:Transcript_4339/g.19386  ORF Transcript_4339/g.19386 Transcript_4339/m.19386 type:complete len:386 (+) Transcript_4339:453-1610(+)